MKQSLFVLSLLLLNLNLFATEPKIVGGTETAANAYLWTAALIRTNENGDYFQCGASLIKSDWLVTAAHCVVGEETSAITAILGRHNLPDRATGEKIKAKKIIVHNFYNDSATTYDIALIQLERPSKQTPVRYITSELSDLIKPGSTATVAGYGRVSQNGAITAKLFSIDIPIVSTEDCRKSYTSTHVNIDHTMLCAGHYEGGKDACQGDSGGPLMVTDYKGKKYLAGIVSFGMGCAVPVYYGVYTNVLELSSWIAFNAK